MSLIGSIFKNQSPWGSSGPTGGNGNGSGSRREPPNIDELIRNIQNKINRFMPGGKSGGCLLYTSPSPRDATLSRMPSSA